MFLSLRHAKHCVYLICFCPHNTPSSQCWDTHLTQAQTECGAQRVTVNRLQSMDSNLSPSVPRALRWPELFPKEPHVFTKQVFFRVL